MSRPNPFDTPKPDRRLRNAAIGVAMLVLVITVTLGVLSLRQAQAERLRQAQAQRLRQAQAYCAPSVRREGGECIGVTDGSYVFDPSLKAGEDCIRERNAWVTSQRGRHYVTIAFMFPLTSTATTSNRTPHLLEGACTAQDRVNEGTYRGDHPLIRMVVANMGANEDRWLDAVHQLEGMTGDPDHLVAVVGLGLSQDETVRAAKQLSSDAIPMVEAVVTGDGIDTSGAGLKLDGKDVGSIPGLTRVSTPVSNQFVAIASYLGQTNLHSAMLVYDSNQSDLYTRPLAQAFTGQLRTYWDNFNDIQEPFDGSLPNAGPGNIFATISNILCGYAPPDMVFYAGREVSLPIFLKALSTRECKSRAITVVTGSDASALTLDSTVPGILAAAPISVLYTPLASPTALDSPANPSQSQFTAFEQSFEQLGLSAADLDDGWAMMAHDAVLTGTFAIRNVVGSSDVMPTTKQVRQQLYTLNGIYNVLGASGTFGIDPVTGSPMGRPLSVFQLSNAAPKPVFVYQYTPRVAAGTHQS